MGFCGRLLVEYNGSKALPTVLNQSMGTYEYVGQTRNSNCTNCSGLYMLKGESRVSLIRMAGRWKFDKYIDYGRAGWIGAVIESLYKQSYVKSSQVLKWPRLNYSLR